MTDLLPDVHYMSLALELAARGLGRTSPNPAVGAVIVNDGRIVGQGYHAYAGGPHAEIEALRQAGDAARGGTLYVTLEPCCHFGRTPPCTLSIIAAGIRRVVLAMVDPNPRVNCGGITELRRAGIDVTTGVCRREAARMNEGFLKLITTGLPLVVLKWAMTLDGKIATRTGSSRWITGPAARELVHRLRDRYDAVLVGRGTVERDDPQLTTRLAGGGGRDPLRIILDSRAQVPPTARCLAPGGPAATIIATTAAAPANRVERLREAGATVWTLPAAGEWVDWLPLLRALADAGVTSLLVEGGAAVHSSALAAGVVDKVIAFIAPSIIGGTAAPGPVGGLGVSEASAATPLDILSWQEVAGDIVIEAYTRRSPVRVFIDGTCPPNEEVPDVHRTG